MMPDPRGGERLLDYECEVYYSKDILEYPIDVKDPDDFEPGTKMPKMLKKPVWLVKIVMPKKLMQEIQQGSLELESATLDMEDVEKAYEEGDDVAQFDQEQENQEQQQNVQQPQF